VEWGHPFTNGVDQMSRKTKINVLLPFKMVGELKRLSKAGKRSDFIMKAIRNRLDGEEEFSFADVETKRLLAILSYRSYQQNNAHAQTMCSLLEELIE